MKKLESELLDLFLKFTISHDFTIQTHEKEYLSCCLFQNLEYEIFSKKPTILGLVHFAKTSISLKKLPVNF
ncbi:hypothetical protein LEP1GSC158_4376 [Leptospira interrogans serovar Zanoni str. LT2156]|uniref:Uncharacterized protein n=1 Tax=Leptospira interrogans serovar Zanoni str. LT2156 TaxID=1001601 RepID=M6HRV2_LEPIR|nr:hypothetical protein LEP1GSC158_4376 [Leptospira interrogans serovar Zanoni str. LT2156]